MRAGFFESGNPRRITKVLVNARYLANPTTGIERVLRAFLDAFREKGEIEGFALLLRAVPEGEYVDFSALERGRKFSGAPAKALFDSFSSGKGAAVRGAGLYFGPSYSVPFFCGLPRVSYAHDLAFLTNPGCYDGGTLAYCAAVLLPSVLAAEAVVTNSLATAAEIRTLPGIKGERIFVAPPPLDGAYLRHSLDPVLTAALADDPATGKLLSRLGVAGPYILNVSTIQPRKNQARLVRAFAALPRDMGRDLSLVIAGRPAWKTGEFRQAFNGLSPSVRARVILAGQISGDNVMRLLSRTRCLAYPSIAEGFGIPAIEAMAMGVPVVSGDNPAPREVCKTASLFADPFDILDIRDAIVTAVSNEGERSRLSMEGRLLASSFTRERFLSGVLAAFRCAAGFTRNQQF